MSSDDLGRDLVIRTTIACGVLETVAVALRMIARWRSQAAFARDDYWIAASLIPSYCMLVVGLLMVTIGGGGKPIETLSKHQLEIFLKTLTASLATYSLTITIVKISILLLYRRVFDTRNIRILTTVLGVVCLAWGVAAILCLIFQCHPISGMWTPEDTFTNKCIDLKAYYAGIAGSNMAIDIILLLIPLYMVWCLGLSTGQKIMLTGIFMLGGLVCVASLMRIITVHFIKGMDITYTITTPYIWSQIEPTSAIICACLTTFRPLFKGLSLRSFSALGWVNSSLNKSSSSGTQSGSEYSLKRWSKMRFSDRSGDRKENRPSPRDNSWVNLKHFQAAGNRATNGGLRMYESRAASAAATRPVSMTASDKGSWLETPGRTSRADSKAGSFMEV